MTDEQNESEGIDLDGIGHIFAQAANGEFAVLDDEARSMDVNEFARAHGKSIRPWGQPKPIYQCIEMGGIEYLWRIDDGTYDGWNMAVS